MRYVKGRLFKRGVRLACTFPRLVKTFYTAYQKLIVYTPFLRTSYKWRMIKTGSIQFEIEKKLYQKGKSNSSDPLITIDYRPGTNVEGYQQLIKNAGSYTLDIVFNGLGIEGQAVSHDTKWVVLKIDQREVKRLNTGEKGRFSIKLKKPLLKKLSPGSTLAVELEDGTRLAHGKSDHAVLSVPFGDGSLEDALNNGFSLTKKGTLAGKSETFEARKEKYLQLYSQVKDAFDQEIGTPLLLMYGTLLGQTREGDFIPNDDDFDAAYVSLKAGPKEVKKETIEIIRKLLYLGFNVSVNPVGRLFKINNNTGVHLDVMPVWFENGWNVAFRGACVEATVKDFLPVKRGLMRGKEVYVPNQPEVFLAGYYGETWRTPDPGYVSNYKQTGKTLLSNYLKYLMTPREFFRFYHRIEEERKSNPHMGSFTASAFKGGFL